jgi:excisionase family DNA binding protein
MQQKKLLTTRQLARYFQKPESTIRRWARARTIPVVKVGWRTRLYDPQAVEQALLRKTVKELK